jgi:phosphomevalonate kinase
LVIAVDRRVVAKRRKGARGSTAFLLAIAEEIGKRFGPDDPATKAAMDIFVDSSPLYQGTTKLGLGSSAAVTVAATALALAGDRQMPVIDRMQVLAIASAAHAAAQASRGASGPWSAGSGADIAAAVWGGVIAFQRAAPEEIAWPSDAAAAGKAITVGNATVDTLAWPPGVTLIPFFTGMSADTPALIRAVSEARAAHRIAVDAALTSVVRASRAACQACAARVPEIAASALIAALVFASHAMDQLASATDLPLVPPCVAAARSALTPLGGTAKTTGAGGGDIAIAVIPATEDAAAATRLLTEAGCQPLTLAVDQTGVDLQPDAQ